MNKRQLIAYTMKYGPKAYVHFKEGNKDTIQGLLYYSPNEDRLFVLNSSSQYQGSTPERDGGEWRKYAKHSWVLIARPPVTGELTYSGLLFAFDWNFALREVYRKKIKVKILHKTMIAVPDKIMYAYYRFPYTALTDFNLNKYPKFVCDKDNNLYNVLYLRRSKRYRLTNVDNLKKRFKVNKTELETKYYDV